MTDPRLVAIRTAEWPRDLPVVQSLWRDYFRLLAQDPAVPTHIRETDREPELGSLASTYASDSTAALLLAHAQGCICGCAAVRLLPQRAAAAEMKRLYVAPEARGMGAGRALIHACADWARQRRARELLLDTLPAAMPHAVRLYRSVGFVPTLRYNQNDAECFGFYRLGLE